MKKSRSKASSRKSVPRKNLQGAVMLGARMAKLGLRAGLLLSKRALVHSHRHVYSVARKTHKMARKLLLH